MKGITPPPFLDRHGVKPGEVVYVCPTVTCRQPHETREEYLAHWDTVHRQLPEPRQPAPATDLIPDGAKVTYATLMAQREGGPLAGMTSTAYLDGAHDGKGHYFGTNKHTDESVMVRWDDKSERWLEVDGIALYRSEKESANAQG